jgi:hypothetical protein
MIVPSVVSWEGVAATAVLIVLPATVCTNAVVATVVELSLDTGVSAVIATLAAIPAVPAESTSVVPQTMTWLLAAAAT